MLQIDYRNTIVNFWNEFIKSKVIIMKGIIHISISIKFFLNSNEITVGTSNDFNFKKIVQDYDRYRVLVRKLLILEHLS